MAAPTLRICQKIFPLISSRNSGLQYGFRSLICSKLQNDSSHTSVCIQRYQSQCARRYLRPISVCQTRHYSFRGFRGQLTFDTPKKSRDFVATLSSKERQLVLKELQGFQERVEMKGETTPIPPTKLELRQVLVSNAIPFVGFGFLDNAIMICAGDYIDLTIGAALCISTMAAAALGNLVSDMAGIGLAGYVEALAIRFGVQSPPLTLEQLDMNSTRLAAGLGRGLGIFIGCLLGMFPLLFIKSRHDVEETTDDGLPETSQI